MRVTKRVEGDAAAGGPAAIHFEGELQARRNDTPLLLFSPRLSGTWSQEDAGQPVSTNVCDRPYPQDSIDAFKALKGKAKPKARERLPSTGASPTRNAAVTRNRSETARALCGRGVSCFRLLGLGCLASGVRSLWSSVAQSANQTRARHQTVSPSRLFSSLLISSLLISSLLFSSLLFSPGAPLAR